MAGIFVNYRGTNQPLGAAAIHDQLARRLGRDLVFRDCVSMRPGEHYPTELTEALEEADVLVAVIGPGWLTAMDENGGWRIDDERDWVRREITRALQRGIPVVPVLLQDTPESAKPPKLHELPVAISRLATIQSLMFSQLRFGRDMDALIARLVGLVPGLVISQLFQPAPRPHTIRSAPSTLLRPGYAVVPFTGRSRELRDLMAWALGTSTYSAMLVVGPAGCGKSRLALELAGALREENWLAGVVSGEAPAAQVRNTLAIEQPMLAIVDDAELRAGELVTLASALAERATKTGIPGRLLLLGRSDGPWLATLRGAAAGKLFDAITARTIVWLDPSPADRRTQFTSAVSAFAEVLGRSSYDVVVRVFPEGITVLRVHAAALRDILDAPSTSDSLADVHALDHDHVRDALAVTGRDDLSAADVAVVRTFATLCRPGSESESDAVRARLGEALGFSSTALTACGALLDAVFAGGPAFGAVRPDAVGEQVVAETLPANPGIVIAVATTCTEDQVLTALTVLGRAMTHHPGLSGAVVRLVRVWPERFLTLGVTASSRLADPEPFVRALAAALPGCDLDPRGTFAPMERLSKAGPALNPLKAAVHLHFTEVFAMPMGNQLHDEVRASVPEPLLGLAERLPRVFADGFAVLVDPQSGSQPRKPDGSPLFDQLLLDTIRNIWVNKDLFGRDDDE